ncbi:MAG: hypothetical protein JSU05_01670, partial [Bacteroidetes bacterium]|nr:hypothetical protein [Bacteroidota bacterium]
MKKLICFFPFLLLLTVSNLHAQKALVGIYMLNENTKVPVPDMTVH